MKKLQANILPWVVEHWLAVALTILCLVCLAILFWWIWQRYGQTILGWWAEVIRKPAIPRNALISIWSDFHRKIPLSLKPVIRNYPVYVVIGDDRSGKTAIINKYVDLDLIDDSDVIDSEIPLMRVRMGFNSILVELSSSFLHANSRDYTDALVSFWSKLPHGTRFVLVVDAFYFNRASEEAKAKTADALSKTLDLFQEVKGESVTFNLALTNMDRFPGYESFYNFTETTGLGVSVNLTDDSPIASFGMGLSHYMQYLPNVLVSTTSREFGAILRFLEESADILKSVENLLFQSFKKNNIINCNLERVCLISEGNSSPLNGSRTNIPFFNDSVIWSPLDVFTRRHLKRFLIIFSVLLILQQFNFWRDRYIIQMTLYYMNNMPSLTQSEYVKKAHGYFVDVNRLLRRAQSSLPVVGFLGIFYEKELTRIDRELDAAIRDTYLIPGLELAQRHEESYRNTIRWLALLHATSYNELGTYFQDNEFDRALNLPHEIIKDYIDSNDREDESDLKKLGMNDYGALDSSAAVKPWVGLAQALDKSFMDGNISPQELESIHLNVRTAQAVYERKSLYPFLDEQKLWLIKNGNISNYTREQWGKIPSQADFVNANLLQSLGLIAHSSIDVVDIPSNILDCLLRVQAMMEEHKKALKDPTFNLGVVRIPIENDYYAFDTNQWIEVMHRSSVKQLLTTFYRTHGSNDGWIFFNPQNTPYRVQLGISSDESGVLINNAQVDIRLTKEAYDQKVKPSIDLLTNLLADVPLTQADKQQLIDFFVSNLSVYSGKYANAYWDFFRNIVIRITSQDQLRSFLKELQRPGAAFVQNLVRIQESVSLDIPSGPNYQPVRDRLADFRFMDKLMQEQAGSYPQLARFIAIITEMSDELDKSDAPVASSDKKDAGGAGGLKSILSPMGRISYNIILHDESSYLTRAEILLRELNVPTNWQKPFLAPFLKAKEFGREEINNTIARNWSNLWSTQVSPLLNYFPFTGNTLSSNDVGPTQLTKIFHPNNGTFWLEVRENYGSLFDTKDGGWKLKSNISQAFAIPADMEIKLNAVSALTIAMWDKDGNEAPIHLSVKADLLPAIKFNEVEAHPTPIATLGFLKSGGASALAFNQHGLWQDLAFEWWQKQPSSVGIELRPQEKESTKKYITDDVEDSYWSLYHLLTQSNKSTANQYDWGLAEPEDPKSRMTISFTFKKNPFELFTALKHK